MAKNDPFEKRKRQEEIDEQAIIESYGLKIEPKCTSVYSQDNHLHYFRRNGYHLIGEIGRGGYGVAFKVSNFIFRSEVLMTIQKHLRLKSTMMWWQDQLFTWRQLFFTFSARSPICHTFTMYSRTRTLRT